MDRSQKWTLESGKIKAEDGSCLSSFWMTSLYTYPCNLIETDVKFHWTMSIITASKSTKDPTKREPDYKILMRDGLFNKIGDYCMEGDRNKQGGVVAIAECDPQNRNQQWHWKVLPDSLPMCRNKCFAETLSKEMEDKFRAGVGNPGNTKNCDDFASYEEAKAWYDTYFPLYRDVANLDGNDDGIPCEALKKKSSPGDIKDCADFKSYEEAKAWYDIYFPLYGDVANLDGDDDGIPCEALKKQSSPGDIKDCE